MQPDSEGLWISWGKAAVDHDCTGEKHLRAHLSVYVLAIVDFTVDITVQTSSWMSSRSFFIKTTYRLFLTCTCKWVNSDSRLNSSFFFTLKKKSQQCCSHKKNICDTAFGSWKGKTKLYAVTGQDYNLLSRQVRIRTGFWRSVDSFKVVPIPLELFTHSPCICIPPLVMSSRAESDSRPPNVVSQNSSIHGFGIGQTTSRTKFVWSLPRRQMSRHICILATTPLPCHSLFRMETGGLQGAGVPVTLWQQWAARADRPIVLIWLKYISMILRVIWTALWSWNGLFPRLLSNCVGHVARWS